MTLSEYRKIARSHIYLNNGKSRLRYEYFLLGAILLLAVIFSLSVFTEKEKSYERGLVFMISQCFMIISFAWSGMFCICQKHVKRKDTQQFGDGCLYITDTYMQFPVTKRSCLIYSYIRYLIYTSPVILIYLLMNIGKYFNASCERYSGEIGLMSICVLIFYILSLTDFIFISYAKNWVVNVVTAVCIAVIVLMTVNAFWLYKLPVMMSLTDSCRKLCGVPGFIIVLSVYPISFIIGKLTVFRKKAKGVWINE